MDRLSRDQEDIAGLFKRLSYLDLQIVIVAEGEVNELHIGLKGTINTLFLKDLAAKIKRGQTGRIIAGRSAGGLSYGYEVARKYDAKGERIYGGRQIREEHAEIVRRIFKEYVSGKSPRAIARDLNREAIPSPTGGERNASTINGNKARGNGILLNPLYIGMTV